jgi:pimeloyl-ACP methyl ester carboxylesterase
MSTLTLDGATLAYESYGQGEPLLFIHGIFVSQAEWQPQVMALARQYQVITCDLRGHGQSSAPLGDYSVKLFAEDMIALLDQLGLAQVVCCGHSFGGMVAQELALSYPERVRGLILADTVHSAWITPLDAMWGWVMGAWVPQLLSVKQQIDLVAGYITMFGPTAQTALAYIEHESQRYINDEPTFYRILQASMQFSSRFRLHQIGCPTLIMVGQYFLQTHLHAYEMWWRIRRAELKIVPQAGHVLNWDNPTVFNQAVEDFMVAL